MNTHHTFPSESMARDAARVWALAKSIGIAMVSTREAFMGDAETMAPDLATGKVPEREGGMADTLVTRPLRARFQDDSDAIWFILPRQSRFAQVIKAGTDHSMLVTFSTGTGGDHIVFRGTAAIHEDRQMLKVLWDARADIHFPKGAADAAAVLLRFEPQTARFWTGGQDFISFVVHYVAAKVTGEPQTVGTQGKVMPVEARP